MMSRTLNSSTGFMRNVPILGGGGGGGELELKNSLQVNLKSQLVQLPLCGSILIFSYLYVHTSALSYLYVYTSALSYLYVHTSALSYLYVYTGALSYLYVYTSALSYLYVYTSALQLPVRAH